MAAQHTPGPWSVATSADHTPLIVAPGRDIGVAFIPFQRDPVCRQAKIAETDANARLISAAPTTAEKAMQFTLLVEGFLRDDTGAEAVTEKQLTDALYALRAHIAAVAPSLP